MIPETTATYQIFEGGHDDEFDRREREYQENRANEENGNDDGLSFDNEEENEESLSTTWDD